MFKEILSIFKSTWESLTEKILKIVSKVIECVMDIFIILKEA